MHDIVIVGGGPAGMTAALYALRNGKTALVIEKDAFGGQITHSPRVENYPGIKTMSGNAFAEALMDQIMALGADIEIDRADGIRPGNGIFYVSCESGNVFEGRTVILANGVTHRMLGLDNEEALTGEGVSYCAVCDGDFYAGKAVCVAGGGNSALQDALLLAGKCSHVTILQDLDCLTGENTLQKALASKPNVTIRTGVKITALVEQGGSLTGVAVKTHESEETIPCDGLFVAIGLIPDNAAFSSVAGLNAWGYYDAPESGLTHTGGIFVAGDARAKEVRQLTTAVGDGATAALNACRYLNRSL